jgi:hypothetical protein
MASKGLHAALRPGLCEILQTDFGEGPKGEVRRNPIPGNSVNKGP